MGAFLLFLILMTGASVRLTRLLVDDAILDGAHAWLDAKAGRTWAFLQKLFGCSWCTGIWVSGAVFGTGYGVGPTKAFVFVCAALTAAYVVGFVSVLDDLLSAKAEVEHRSLHYQEM